MKYITTNEVLNIVNDCLKNGYDNHYTKTKEIKEITRDQINIDLTGFVDSITFIHIIVALEERFELEIPDEFLLLTEMNSISKIVEVLKEVSKAANADNW